MSSTFTDHQNYIKIEHNENSGAAAGVGNLYSPSPSLKLNKESHVIKKPPPSPSSSSTAQDKPRHPVIIYTHTPKIIHTNTKDFMALVQKLTGRSNSDEDLGGKPTAGKSVNRNVSDTTVDRKISRNRGGHNSYQRSYSGAGGSNGKGMFFNNGMISDDSESSSVITTDEVNSSLPYSTMPIPPLVNPPPLPLPLPLTSSMYDAAGINCGGYLSSTYPISPPTINPDDNFFCGNQQFANFDDPFLFPDMRNSFSSSSSSGFGGLSEFHDL